MEPDKLGYDLNNVIGALCDGLGVLAEKVRCGANRDELADAMDAMARSICERWPDCLSELKEDES